MKCYSPVTGYRKIDGYNRKTRKWAITFNVKEGYYNLRITVPCGNCIGCRLEKSRQWSVRCMHESKSHKQNSFVTLTYNQDNLPSDGSISKTHIQLFLKRLRDKYGELRYLLCGEYGDLLSRPHYHAIIFGIEFDDKKYHKTENGNKVYTSEILQKLWGKGYCLIGSVTEQSTGYVARYVTKKITGKKAEEHYSQLHPEFLMMSLKPGIGKKWLLENHKDVYPHDYVMIRPGVKCSPPKYYDTLYEKEFPEKFKLIKQKRKETAKLKQETAERMLQMEKCKIQQISPLTRNYENADI